MTCPRCRKKFDQPSPRCPFCGQPTRDASGLFQTSTVLISAEGADRVYRSMDEVPAGLRTKLLKSTNGANAATILIADRRGRKEIARAMRNLPGPAQRRLRNAVLGDRDDAPATWLSPHRTRALLLLVLILTLMLIAAALTYRWELPLR